MLEGKLLLIHLVLAELLEVEALLQQVKKQVVIDPELKAAFFGLAELELVALQHKFVQVETLV